jgi:hypothetical protein
MRRPENECNTRTGMSWDKGSLSVGLMSFHSTENHYCVALAEALPAVRHKQIDEVRSGGSYMSQNDFRLHFGLGSARTADISVRWLDGKVETFKSALAGQLLTIEEGEGIVHTQRYTSAKK